MKKRGIITTVCFLLILCFFTLGSLFVPDRDFSAEENRPLTVFPKLSVKGVLSGEAQQKINDYFSDQLILRNTCISAKTILQKATGKRDIGGVYLCRNKFYIEKITEDSLESEVFARNISSIEQFMTTNKSLFSGNMKVLAAPAPEEVLSSLLPKAAPVFNAEQKRKMLKSQFAESFVDSFDDFSNSKDPEQLFYKTDHHWTTLGAKIAYESYCAAIKTKPAEIKLKTVARAFRGTLYSKVLDPFSAYDTISSADALSNAKLKVGEKQYDSIFNTAALKTKDKYEYFLYGNHAVAEITGGKGNKKLLVVKDSYANCMVPMLLNNYGSITLVDTRYFTGSLKELAKNGDYNDFLVLFSLKGLLTETTLPIINA